MKTSIIVQDTTFSERNKNMFIEINNVVSSSLEEVNVCYLNLSNHMLKPEFAIMNITEIYNFFGTTLIATNDDTADVLAKACINANKIYYMWDLSFLLKSYDYAEVYNRLKHLKLVVRSTHHQKIIKNLFNLESFIVPVFKLEALWNLQ